MAADKLRGRVNYNVCTMLNGANQVGSTEGVVHDKRNVMAVGHFGYCL